MEMSMLKENLQLKLQLIQSQAQLAQLQLNMLGVDYERVRQELEQLEEAERLTDKESISADA